MLAEEDELLLDELELELDELELVLATVVVSESEPPQPTSAIAAVMEPIDAAQPL